MASRVPLVAGNWKMHNLRGDAHAYSVELISRLDELERVAVAICPPLSCLDVVAATLRSHNIGVYAQNAHQALSGAFTGEVSMPMLIDAGASGVLLGHSERRAWFGETDAALAEKVPAAVAAGLDVILCVGETGSEREAGLTEQRLRTQLETGLSQLDADGVSRLVIAYEPVWAIGTGLTATPDTAQHAHRYLRGLLEQRFGAHAACIRILYGGSVNATNAAALFAEADIDGGLVGGASLEVPGFVAIATHAQPR